MSAPSPSTVAPPVMVAAGTTAAEALAAAGEVFSGPDAVVVVRDADGALHDLDWTPIQDVPVEPVLMSSPHGRNVLRHSTAHVLAQAVQDLFPAAKLGIGPPIENGFYYDFDVPEPFKPEDIKRIESRMRDIIKTRQRFSRRVVTEEAARTELSAEPYKLELIGLKGSAATEAAEGASAEVGGSELTVYDNLDAKTGERVWGDLCRGPHLPSTRSIPAFKLMRSAAAYWRGSEQNPQLQRIYGTAWESRQALDAHLVMMAEAERRDHRRIGAALDLFSFPDEIGSGLAVFHPKGGIIRREMEAYSRTCHEAAGYEFVNTPHITKSTLFETSGHLGWYADGMFPPMEMEGADYYLKPMNCPMHILIYRSRGRSYRELPLRLFEFGSVYRYEKSGTIHGLTRVRGLTQDDAHIFCTPEQLGAELASLLKFVVGLLRDFGLTDFEAELATRKESYIGTPEEWDHAEAMLESALREAGLDYVVAPGEATFYAPKIDVHVRDAIGRRWQMSTLQVDLQLPARFALEYQSEQGSRLRPYMIHRALFGSIERFFGILTEHYAGAFPVWLAPVQVVGIPVTDAQVGYLDGVIAQLRTQRIRAAVDSSGDRMQKKIRTASQQKVPFVLIAGAADQEAGAVSFRFRNGSQRNAVPVPEALSLIVDFAASRSNTDPVAPVAQPEAVSEPFGDRR
ncbi:MAG: threonine--tRNA ligase [Actinomycetota bacterium]|nr:threonine--tRNA ligase [Actinomycetota bacterium]